MTKCDLARRILLQDFGRQAFGVITAKVSVQIVRQMKMPCLQHAADQHHSVPADAVLWMLMGVVKNK